MARRNRPPERYAGPQYEALPGGATAARPVLDPLAVGRIGGVSYAVMPYCLELARGRVAWRLQRSWPGPALFDWLWRSTAAPLLPAPEDECESHFEAALARLATLEPLSASVRASALHGLRRLRGGL